MTAHYRTPNGLEYTIRTGTLSEYFGHFPHEPRTPWPIFS